MRDAPQSRPAFIAAAPFDQVTGAGAVFGGWIMGACDQAAGLAGHRIAGTCIIRSFKDLSFHAPLKPGLEFAIYAAETRRGNTSFTLALEGWADMADGPVLIVTAEVVLVALGADHRPRQLSD